MSFLADSDLFPLDGVQPFDRIGKLEGDHQFKWRDDRVFTGNDPSYPIELFIALVEGEAKFLQQDEARVVSNAWCLIHSADGVVANETPAGNWKASMVGKYGDVKTVRWEDFKTDLLEAFGRRQQYQASNHAIHVLYSETPL